MKRRFVELIVCGSVVVGFFVFCGALKFEMSRQGYPTTLEEAYPDSDDPMSDYKTDLEWLKDNHQREQRWNKQESKRRANQ